MLQHQLRIWHGSRKHFKTEHEEIQKKQKKRPKQAKVTVYVVTSRFNNIKDLPLGNCILVLSER